MNTLFWLCQNTINWSSTPESQQGEEDHHLFFISAIAIGAIAAAGVFYSLARRNSSPSPAHEEVVANVIEDFPVDLIAQEAPDVPIEDEGDLAKAIVWLIQRLPEPLRTQKIEKALVASGENAEGVAHAISLLPEDLFTRDDSTTQEILDAFVANGANARVVAEEVRFWPKHLITRENLSALLASGANIQIVARAIAIVSRDPYLLTPESLGALVASGANALTMANAINDLPENLQTRENVDALAASGVNAVEIVMILTKLLKKFVDQEQENFNALIASGANVIHIGNAFYGLPNHLRTQENFDALIASKESAGAIYSIMYVWLPNHLKTQENLDRLIANGANAQMIKDSLWCLPRDLRTQANLNAFFSNNDPDRFQEILDGVTAIRAADQEVTQQQFDEIVRIADANASYWLKGAVEE